MLPPPPPARELAVSTDAADALVARVEQAVASAGQSELEIHEEELTSYVVLHAQDPRLRSLHIWITPQGVLGRARVTLRHEHTALALLQPSAREGRLRVGFMAATWDGRALPRWLLASAEAALNDAIADADLPAAVDQVVLGEGSMRVTVTRR